MAKNIPRIANNSQINSDLLLASKEGSISSIKKLISQGVDVNTTNEVGQTALFLACWNGHLQAAQLLVMQGANPDLQDQRGWTPIIISAFHGFHAIVKLLIRNKANIGHRDIVFVMQFGKRAIDRAKDQDVIKLLDQAARHKYHSASPSRPLQHNRSSSTGKFTPKVDNTSREDIDRYLTERGIALQKQFTDDWSKKIQDRIDTELSQGGQKLSKQVDSMLKSLQNNIFADLCSSMQCLGEQQEHEDYDDDSKKEQSLLQSINQGFDDFKVEIEEYLEKNMAAVLGQMINTASKMIEGRINANSQGLYLSLTGEIQNRSDALCKKMSTKTNPVAHSRSVSHGRPASAAIAGHEKSRRIESKAGIGRTNVSSTLKEFLKLERLNNSMMQ